MKTKTLLALAVGSMLAALSRTRAHTQDISFTYRMGAGFPGDINRVHPFSAIPGLINQTLPPRLYGDPVLYDGTNGFRGFQTTDATTPVKIAGVAVRPYPTQQSSGGMTSTFGVGVPALNQPLDVLQDGFIMAKVNGSTLPVKGGGVWVYVAASNGAHVLGGFEAAAGTSLLLVSNAEWVGPPDANGIAELRIFS